MPERLTIELEPHVVAWLKEQADELAGEVTGQGGDLSASSFTVEVIAAAFVTSQYEQWHQPIDTKGGQT